jgi:hypothetical protein
VETNEINTESPKLVKRVHKLAEAASKTIVPINNDRIDQSLATGFEKSIQCRAMLLGTAETGIDILLSNFPPAVCAVLANFLQLHLGILCIVSAYPGVDSCAFHS